MRPKGSAAELERRRRRAVELVEAGESPSTVARIFGVHETSMHRWRRLARTEAGLSAKPQQGPTPRLSDEQLARLETLLLEGAEHHGWPNSLWTAGRVTALIQRHFGLQFHPEHVRRILKDRLNWSSQRPQRQHRANGNDAAIALWVTEEFPRILSEAARRNAHLAFVDETGFMLNPLVRRTLAPRGQTPVNRVADPHARISVIGAITVDPQRRRVGLVYNMLGDNANFRAPGVAHFVGMLRAEVAGPLTVLWDRVTIHSCEQVERCLLGLSDVVAEPFPPHAPKLNPADGIWGYIKYGRLPNYTPPDLDVLRTTITAELDRLRQEEGLLRSFIRHTKLPLDL